MQQDLETIKSQVKENIQVLIDNNQLEEANILIDEYFRISNDDVEVYSMKAVVLIIKGQIDKAEELLLNALNYASYNFDLNYNLGYIYYNKKEYELGLQYYTKAYMATNDEEIKKNIKSIIKEILSELNFNQGVETFLESNIVKIENDKVQRCLVLCHFYSVYTKEFLEKIYNKANIKFDILTIDSSYKEKVKSGSIENVYTYNDLNKMNQILNSNGSYDIIHIHFLAPFYGEIAEQIRNKCKKLMITIWGSDFYRTTNEQKEEQRKLVDKADIITFDNDVTMEEFAKYYDVENNEKLSINRFGLTALEYIKNLENKECNQIRAEYNIPENSIVVTCGYNANRAHNHLEIIKSINQMKNKLPKNMYYIFPMTYSRDEEYCHIVKRELEKSSLKYIILEEFMSFEQMAKLTKITDIMIQLQTTDTLSATMQEHMYHGNVVITGSWLPYKPLKQIGTYFLEVYLVNKIGKKLIDVVQDITLIKQRCKKNKNIIWNFSAWENTIKDWIEIYNKKIDYKLPQFNHAAYWDYRYGNKFDLESSGYMGLGIIYNSYLYKSRIDILDYLKKHLLEGFVDKRILELGVGTGYFTNYFSEQTIKSYYGIDISQKSVENLSLRHKGFEFKCGDISDEKVYEYNKKYDLIFASDVLLHLTDDEKFAKSIHNIASVLDENGYFIDIEPITMIGIETNSPHNRIIKYDELEVALENEDLEIVDNIPVTFFMDYPFDYEILGSNGRKAINIFNEISSFLQSNEYALEEKKEMVEKLYRFDKKFLKHYGKGLSNKLIIIKKKGVCNNKKILLDDIWINSDISVVNDFYETKIGKLINDLDGIEYN